MYSVMFSCIFKKIIFVIDVSSMLLFGSRQHFLICGLCLDCPVQTVSVTGSFSVKSIAHVFESILCLCVSMCIYIYK